MEDALGGPMLTMGQPCGEKPVVATESWHVKPQPRGIRRCVLP